MDKFDEDGWLSPRLDMLKPGWRGRLRLLAPEEARTSTSDSIIGTIVGDVVVDRDVGSDDVIDAVITVCANFRRGRFVPVDSEPHFTVRASQIIAMEPM
jgi:hypothetical protein